MKTTYYCSECCAEVEFENLAVDQAMACPDHPSAQIDSVRGEGGSATRIGSRADLIVHLNDTRSDLTSLDARYVSAVCDQIQASDHPAWGADWADWFSTDLDALITATVDALDALPRYKIVCTVRGEIQHSPEYLGEAYGLTYATEKEAQAVCNKLEESEAGLVDMGLDPDTMYRPQEA